MKCKNNNKIEKEKKYGSEEYTIKFLAEKIVAKIKHTEGCVKIGKKLEHLSWTIIVSDCHLVDNIPWLQIELTQNFITIDKCEQQDKYQLKWNISFIQY